MKKTPANDETHTHTPGDLSTFESCDSCVYGLDPGVSSSEVT